MAASMKCLRMGIAIAKLQLATTNKLCVTACRRKWSACAARKLHTNALISRNFTCSSRCLDLMDFFDDQTNWETFSVKTGRSWLKSELRTRSNEDLHKLWYVLLKEMNMLLTMQAEYHRLAIPMPSEERLEKVEVSMDNLRDVVDERNKAYHMLEYGEPPHPKWINDIDELGRPQRRLEEEHLVPMERNEEFLSKYDHQGDYQRKYYLLWKEQQKNREKYYTKKARNLHHKLLAKYPHLHEDREFVWNYAKDKTFPVDPNPDIEKLIEEQDDDLYDESNLQ